MTDDERLKELAAGMAMWFRNVKPGAHIGGGMYRVKMDEANYDAIIGLFDAIADGSLVLNNKAKAGI